MVEVLQTRNIILREKLRILQKFAKNWYFVILRFVGDLKFLQNLKVLLFCVLNFALETCLKYTEGTLYKNPLVTSPLPRTPPLTKVTRPRPPPP